jgi:hypothetical protein
MDEASIARGAFRRSAMCMLKATTARDGDGVRPADAAPEEEDEDEGS